MIIRGSGLFVTPEGEGASALLAGSALRTFLEEGSASHCSGSGPRPESAALHFSSLLQFLVFWAYIESCSVPSHRKSNVFIVSFVCLMYVFLFCFVFVNRNKSFFFFN